MKYYKSINPRETASLRLYCIRCFGIKISEHAPLNNRQISNTEIILYFMSMFTWYIPATR